MNKIAIALILTASLRAQSFSNWQPVQSRSDRDFKVQWSNGGPAILVDVLRNGRITRESRAYYMTVVRGNGKLTKLQVNPDTTVLLTIEGLKDHAVWLVLMNLASSQSEGVRFWQVGDTIHLDTDTILINDDHIPKVQNSESLTNNMTVHCVERAVLHAVQVDCVNSKGNNTLNKKPKPKQTDQNLHPALSPMFSNSRADGRMRSSNP